MDTPHSFTPQQAPALDAIVWTGKPSQMINLPMLLKAVVAVGFFGWVATLGLHWTLGVIPACLIVLLVVVRWLGTHCTEIAIDAERVTVRSGILSKEVNSLELFRVHDVTSMQPWWLRPFKLGHVILLTTDSNNPRWSLWGMEQPEQMRQRLNQAAIALRERKGIREVNMAHV